jgi:hypothetical protein
LNEDNKMGTYLNYVKDTIIKEENAVELAE